MLKAPPIAMSHMNIISNLRLNLISSWSWYECICNLIADNYNPTTCNIYTLQYFTYSMLTILHNFLRLPALTLSYFLQDCFSFYFYLPLNTNWIWFAHVHCRSCALWQNRSKFQYHQLTIKLWDNGDTAGLCRTLTYIPLPYFIHYRLYNTIVFVIIYEAIKTTIFKIQDIRFFFRFD